MCLYFQFTKFSPRDFRFRHTNPILPFREFDPDRPEEKEVWRVPVRFFEKNLCTIVTVQFTWLQQASWRQFSQCPRRPVGKTHLTCTLSARSSLWSLLLHFVVVLVQQTYNQDESVLNSVKNSKRRNQPSLSDKKNILPFLTLRALVRLPSASLLAEGKCSPYHFLYCICFWQILQIIFMFISEGWENFNLGLFVGLCKTWGWRARTVQRCNFRL